MKPYLAQIKSNLRLMGRDRALLFYNYLFPLSFFFIFAQAFGASKSPAAMAQVISAVLIIGILGAGFFGAGMRSVQERETGILRRFKVAPHQCRPHHRRRHVLRAGRFPAAGLHVPHHR